MLPTDETEYGLLPTPKARDWKGPEGRSYKGETMDLPAYAKMTGMLPTPTAISDAKGGCTRSNPKMQRATLAHAMHLETGGIHGTTSHLNPLFVEQMMGYPKNWTNIEYND
jgi:hypothetical protein